MPQFLPSSYKNYSLNSKSFEEWLTSKEGAVISIANYLKSNGWKKDLPLQKKKQVIWSYNHSTPYVDTILQIARKITPEARGSRPRSGKPTQNKVFSLPRASNPVRQDGTLHDIPIHPELFPRGWRGAGLHLKVSHFTITPP